MSDALKPVIEALIFASPDPLTPKMLFKLLESEPKEDVEAALDALKRDYERPGGLQLVEVAGGYQIVTKPELHEWGGACFTSGRRSVCRCRRSRRSRSSRTSNPLPRTRSPRSAASTPPASSTR